MLQLISRQRAERIFAGKPLPTERWAADYPLPDELDALRFFLSRAELSAEQAAFGRYSIHDQTGLAVGGIGFFGPPDEEAAVTIGYGIVPSARRRGLARAAVTELLGIAAGDRVHAVHAVTDLDNLPSQGVLLGTGFSELRRDAEQVYFSRRLTATGHHVVDAGSH